MKAFFFISVDENEISITDLKESDIRVLQIAIARIAKIEKTSKLNKIKELLESEKENNNG